MMMSAARALCGAGEASTTPAARLKTFLATFAPLLAFENRIRVRSRSFCLLAGLLATPGRGMARPTPFEGFLSLERGSS
jgi:hypothetical protein